MSAQIVLVPGWNDGAELVRTLRELGALYPYVTGVAIVPVGITRYRDKLPELKGFDSDEAGMTIDAMAELQREFIMTRGTYFARCADEFYCLAGRISRRSPL